MCFSSLTLNGRVFQVLPQVSPAEGMRLRLQGLRPAVPQREGEEQHSHHSQHHRESHRLHLLQGGRQDCP